MCAKRPNFSLRCDSPIRNYAQESVVILGQHKSGRAQALRFASDTSAKENITATPSDTAYRTACAVPLLSTPTPLVATPLRCNDSEDVVILGQLKSGRAQALRFASDRGATENIPATPSDTDYRTACAVPLLSTPTPIVAAPLRCNDSKDVAILKQHKSGRAQALRFASDRGAKENIPATPSDTAYRTACAVPLLSTPTPIVAAPLRFNDSEDVAILGQHKSGRAQALRFALERGGIEKPFPHFSQV